MFPDAALTTSDGTLALLLSCAGAALSMWVLIIRRQLLVAWWNLDSQKSALNAQLASRAWLASAQLSLVGTETLGERALLAELGRRLDAVTAAANDSSDVRAVVEHRLEIALEAVIRSLRRYSDATIYPQHACVPAAVAETTRAIDAAANIYNDLVGVFNRRLNRFPATLAGDSLRLRMAQQFDLRPVAVRDDVHADHGQSLARLVDARAHDRVDGRAHGLLERAAETAAAI